MRILIAGSKLMNNCGAQQLLQMVMFIDISAISEPILIKPNLLSH